MKSQALATIRAQNAENGLLRSASAYAARCFHALLPNQCALCGNLSRSVLCEGCDEAHWNEPRLRCSICALPLPARGRRSDHASPCCSTCAEEPPHFDATLALADYRAPVDTLAVELKFRGRIVMGGVFARHLSALFENSDLPKPDVVVAVPLSRKRLLKRGYNQAWAIAKPLARLLDVPIDPHGVERTVDTAPQSKLDLDTRRRNVGRAFAVRRNVRGLHVAVVDDVMTSGATLDALARTLKAAGARRVTNFIALRTPKN
jgi:ComF family protein